MSSLRTQNGRTRITLDGRPGTATNHPLRGTIVSTTIPSITDSTSTYPDALRAMTLLLEQQTADVRHRRLELDQTPAGDLELYTLLHGHRAARSALRGILAAVRASALPVHGEVLDAADAAAEHDQ